ncbi:MAG: GNAT family N-acetyltransferase [Chitinophagales bacterium]|nr:GNAT family N-acetyltransferase [Chitinophagales bacterium]
MKRANIEDKDLVVDMLLKSFDSNLSVNYIIKQDGRRRRRLEELMSYSFDVCRLFGDVFLSDDNRACALILYPDKKKATARSTWLDLKLVFRSIGFKGISKTLEREALLKQVRGSELKIILWFIGVNPKDQHKGLGNNLLNSIIAYSDELSRPIYLETSNNNNLPWYEKFGFEIYAQKELDHTLYFLRRLTKK